jgi:hypothetical protein
MENERGTFVHEDVELVGLRRRLERGRRAPHQFQNLLDGLLHHQALAVQLLQQSTVFREGACLQKLTVAALQQVNSFLSTNSSTLQGLAPSGGSA